MEKRNTRNEALKNIRPTLPIETTPQDGTEAVFMHETLRPVLKFQHAILVGIIQNDENLSKQLARTQKATDTVVQYLKTNQLLRQLLIGITVGCFTEDELEQYLEHRRALDKRIISMITTRYLSTLTED